MSAKKNKRKFIINRYLYGKNADVSKYEGKKHFFVPNVILIKSA